MHAIAARFVIAGGYDSAPVATAAHCNRAIDEAGIVAHLDCGEKAIGITVDNFTHRSW